MRKKIIIGCLIGMAVIIFGYGCKKDAVAEVETKATILPSTFNVEVPTSLSSNTTVKSGSASIDGNEIYRMMRAFIFVGNVSGRIINSFMSVIVAHDINHAMDVNFTSNDDLLLKRLVVTENVLFENKTYEYKMVVYNVSDNSIGVEMYWNRSPVKGVAIMQSYNLNRREPKNHKAKIRIDYSEAETAYQKQMEISIVGLDTIGVNDNVDNLKMFVGKNNDIVDVYGNANLPDTKIINQKNSNGYSWAFVGRSNEKLNIAVAKVALPTCNLTDMTDMLSKYSIKNVLNQEIHDVYDTTFVKSNFSPMEIQLFIDRLLINTGTPAYFNGIQGFLCSGDVVPTTPAGFTSEFVNLTTLTPYVPALIDNLQLNFSTVIQ